MSLRSFRAIWIVPVVLALSTGCTATPEPEDAYVAVADQTYPFDAVWQCAAEAIEVVGYTILESKRNGDDDGWITTDFKIVKESAFSEAQEALRLQIKVAKKGEKTYGVSVAPSRFKREYHRDDWSYFQKDADLLQAFDKALYTALQKRYRGG